MDSAMAPSNAQREPKGKSKQGSEATIDNASFMANSFTTLFPNASNVDQGMDDSSEDYMQSTNTTSNTSTMAIRMKGTASERSSGGPEQPQPAFLDQSYTITSHVPVAAISTPIGLNSQARQLVQSSRALKSRDTKINGMEIFSAEVEEPVLQRYKQISESLEPGLVAYLSKKRVDFRPITTQLLVLGKTVGDAKPWIVIRCPKSAKRTQRFLAKDFAKNLCQGPESSSISLEIIVGPPLGACEGDEPDDVFIEQLPPESVPHWTPRIRVVHAETAHYATMGGFVSMDGLSGAQNILGFTAGHVLSRRQLQTIEDSDTSDNSGSEEDSEDDSSGKSSDTEDSSIDGGTIDTNSGVQGEICDNLNNRQWSELGTMDAVSYRARAQDRDWALINLSDTYKGRFDPAKGIPKTIYQAVSPGRRRHALVNNNSMIHCSISKLPARAMLPSAQVFVDVHVLQLPEGEVLPDASSGSWIIGSSPKGVSEVYGVLIATDPTGYLWMVPMVDISNDIRQEFPGSDIRLFITETSVSHDRHSRASASREPSAHGSQDHAVPSNSAEILSTVGFRLYDTIFSQPSVLPGASRPRPGVHPLDAPSATIPLTERTVVVPTVSTHTVSSSTRGYSYSAGHVVRAIWEHYPDGKDSSDKFRWYCGHCRDGPYPAWQVSCMACQRVRS